MKGPTTTIVDPATGKDKPYTFDYSFWSHDSFDTSEDGYMTAQEGSNYADQENVYNALGKEVLDNAWQGFHCCLFAYGQTGSGKSYSMVGYGSNKGIVPQACDEIFKRIEANDNKNLQYQVQFSMLEIYNEKVQDLLVSDLKNKPAGGLKVRESQTGAVYVQGLSKHPVDSYKMIAEKTDEGYNNRSIGSTLMNQTSSRAHTIIAIEFKQILQEDGRKTEKFSVINLVDLAGSEKAGQTGAEGQRLKEGCAINKSLTVLGTCISVLADKACGKQQKTVVPYRDSNLTRILQNALGGNSKTIMVCAVSPASMNYEESLSTLRYADRAKKIVNKAVVNESAQEKLIRELRSENEQLKKLLLTAAAGGGQINLADLGMGSAEDIIASMEHAEEQLNEIETPFEQKLAEQKEADKKRDVALEEKRKKENPRAPHLSNLNEDPQLSQTIYYGLTNFPVRVGRKTDKPKPQIIFGGVSVQRNHGEFVIVEGGHIQFQLTNKESYEQTLINGQRLNNPDDPKQIMSHLDVLYFGSGAMLLFKYPLQVRTLENFKISIRNQAQEDSDNFTFKSEEEINILAQAQLYEDGITDDLTNLVCDDYSENEMRRDHDMIDFEIAYEEVQRIEEQKKQEQLQAIQESERKRLEEEFEIKQQEEKQRGEQKMNELLEKQKELQEQQAQREEEMKAQEAAERQRLKDELLEKEKLLEQNMANEEDKIKALAEQEEIKRKFQEEMDKANEDKEKQAEAIKMEMEKQNIELEMIKRKMQQDQDKHQKDIAEQKKKYENQLKTDQQFESIRQRMKDIRKDVAEANEIAKFMNKDVVFTDTYVTKLDDQYLQGGLGTASFDLGEMPDEVQVKVENFDTNQISVWSCDKFQDKLMMMRDALQIYEDREFQELDPSEDPFYEKQEPILLGQAFYMLEGLAYLMDNPRKIPIIATNNQVYGQLTMNVLPCEENGNEELDEDNISDNPEDLIGNQIDFKVIIENITNLPEDFCRNIYCEYEFYVGGQKYKTSVCQGKNQSPQFDYVNQHHVDCVTKFMLTYLLEDKLTIKIYGTQDLKRKKDSKLLKPPVQQERPTSKNKSKSTIGQNSTMNSSNSSVKSVSSSGANYKLQPQPVQNPNMVGMGSKATASQNKADMVNIDPLRSLQGSYKNQPAQPLPAQKEKDKEKKGWFNRNKK